MALGQLHRSWLLFWQTLRQQQLRDRHLANRCYDGYEQIVDACMRRLECFHANPWRHPLFVLPKLGNTAFGFGYLMTWNWY